MHRRSPYSVSNQKIDPSRRRASHLDVLPDGTPNDNDRIEIGPTDKAFNEWSTLGLTPPDMHALREYRLSRLVKELAQRDYAGLLMFDPLNIRYATDTTNMQLWIAHNPARACFVSATGNITLWDFHSCAHLSAHLPLVNEVRSGASFFYFESGNRVDEHAQRFAAEVNELLALHGGNNRRLAVDKMEYAGACALQALGVDIKNGQEVTEHARKIKNTNELNAMRCAIAACEAAMGEMQSMMHAGLTEVELWAELQRGNHIRGGEWIETRILSSGPRTNPWFQEAGPRVIADGDILAFDTDLIGPYGYCADISRTWKVGEQKPTDYEKTLYQHAYEHIQTNMTLLKPGMNISHLTHKGHRLDKIYRQQRYGVMFHGVGLCDEYPCVRYPEDIDSSGYDAELEVGQCLCVEAYVGEVGGPCGIKLEDQVVITESGFENLTNYPFDEDFLG